MTTFRPNFATSSLSRRATQEDADSLNQPDAPEIAFSDSELSSPPAESNSFSNKTACNRVYDTAELMDRIYFMMEKDCLGKCSLLSKGILKAVAKYLWMKQNEGIQTKLIDVHTPLVRQMLYMESIKVITLSAPIRPADIDISRLLGTYPSLHTCHFISIEPLGLRCKLSRGLGSSTLNELSLHFLDKPPPSDTFTLTSPGLGLKSTPGKYKLVEVVCGDENMLGKNLYGKKSWSPAKFLAPLKPEGGDEEVIKACEIRRLQIASGQVIFQDLNDLLPNLQSLGSLGIHFANVEGEDTKRLAVAAFSTKLPNLYDLGFFTSDRRFHSLEASHYFFSQLPKLKMLHFSSNLSGDNVSTTAGLPYKKDVTFPTLKNVKCPTAQEVRVKLGSALDGDHMSVAMVLLQNFPRSCVVHFDSRKDEAQRVVFEKGVLQARELWIRLLVDQKSWKMLTPAEAVKREAR